MTVSIDGQAVSIHDAPEAVRCVEAALSDARGLTLLTLTLDNLVKRRQNATFRAAYARATHVAAAGRPIVALAGRVDPAIRRTPGADLMIPMCRMAARRGVPIYFLGAGHAPLVGAALELRHACPGLDVRDWDVLPPGADATSARARKAIANLVASGARLCFIALDSPRQELFADIAHAACPDIAFICVGSSLDGFVDDRCPPRIIRTMRLEWAWWLAQQPRRLNPRSLRAAVLFAELIVGAKTSHIA